jgi:hypothetical protein
MNRSAAGAQPRLVLDPPGGQGGRAGGHRCVGLPGGAVWLDPLEAVIFHISHMCFSGRNSKNQRAPSSPSNAADAYVVPWSINAMYNFPYSWSYTNAASTQVCVFVFPVFLV